MNPLNSQNSTQLSMNHPSINNQHSTQFPLHSQHATIASNQFVSDPSLQSQPFIQTYTEKLQVELSRSRWWIMKLASERNDLIREQNVINCAVDSIGKHARNQKSTNNQANNNKDHESEIWKAVALASLRELHYRNELTPEAIDRIKVGSAPTSPVEPSSVLVNSNAHSHFNEVPQPAPENDAFSQGSILPMPNFEPVDLSSFLDPNSTSLYNFPQNHIEP